MSIIEAIKKLLPDEIIDGESVEETAKLIDLDIAFKLLAVPEFVHQSTFELTSNIPEVNLLKKRPDGNYEIHTKTEAGPDLQIVSADEAKIMRARFLMLKGFYCEYLEGMSYPQQKEVVAKYDIVYIPNL